MNSIHTETRSYLIYRADGFYLKRHIGIGYDIFSPVGSICAFAETEDEVEEKITREKKEWLCKKIYR